MAFLTPKGSASPSNIKALSISSGEDDESCWEKVGLSKPKMQIVSVEQGTLDYFLYSTHHPGFQFPPASRFLDRLIYLQEWQMDAVDHPIDALWFSTSNRHVYYILRDIGSVYPGIKRLTLLMWCPLNVVSCDNLASTSHSDSLDPGKAGQPFGNISKTGISLHQALLSPRCSLARLFARPSH